MIVTLRTHFYFDPRNGAADISVTYITPVHDMKKYWALLILFITAVSCYRPQPYTPHKLAGYKAVYSNDPQLKKISFTASQTMSSPGKIYAKGNIILQNDIGRGIHVFDASIPSELKKLGFIIIPGNVELSIKANELYANSYEDLVVIDISDPLTPKEINRVTKAFTGLTGQLEYSLIPFPEPQTYYECIDPSKGTHTGWRKDTLVNECYFYNF